MKRLILVLAAAAAIGIPAFAQGAPKAGEFGIQTSVALSAPLAIPPLASLGVKYWINDAMALRAGLGFASQSGASTTTGFDLGGGFEYHFAGKGGVSPYVGVQAMYGSLSPSGGTATTNYLIGVVFGGEYFFSSNFSWGGEFGLGVGGSDTGGVTSTLVGTIGAATLLTWYLN
ncbi:MAG: hypothetical protein ABSG63_10295 [Spirochaetia bacterium]|jgi:hypothetical protein